jgi:hypothetical protein
VEISRSNKIEGRATVHTRAGSVIRETPVDISIPQMEVPKLPALEEDLAILEAELDERLALENDANVRMAMQAEGDRLLKRARGLLSSPAPDRQEVWLAVRGLDRKVRPPRDELNPTLANFEGIVLRIRDVLAGQGSDPNVQAHARIVDRLENEGRAAHARRDARRWAQANDGLRSLLSRVERPARAGHDDSELPPADLQKMIAGMQLDQVRQELRAKEADLTDRGDGDRFRSRTDRIRAEIEAVQASIEQIEDDAGASVANARIQLMKHKMRAISDDIQFLDDDIR